MSTSEKKTTFNVAVIGYGLSAKVFHLPYLAQVPQLNLHTIIQRSPSTSTTSAPADYPALTHHTTVDPMLADPSVDVVLVLTPPDSHFDLASRALRAGKHVLVEKPFVPTSAQASTLAVLAREQGRLLCVYQNRRWDADFLTLRSLLDNGELGRVVEMDTHFDRYRPAVPAPSPAGWKARLGMEQGGGLLYDLGSHLVDQVYVLFGMPRAVYGRFVDARRGRLLSGDGGGDQPDGIHAVLSYADGLVVSVRGGVMSVEKPQVRFWVRGTRGSWRKYGLDAQEGQLKEGLKPGEDGFGIGVGDERDGGRLTRVVVGDDGSEEFEAVEGQAAPALTYRRLFEDFAEALVEGDPGKVPVTAEQAADVLRILEATKESAATGKEVVFG